MEEREAQAGEAGGLQECCAGQLSGDPFACVPLLLPAGHAWPPPPWRPRAPITTSGLPQWTLTTQLTLHRGASSVPSIKSVSPPLSIRRPARCLAVAPGSCTSYHWHCFHCPSFPCTDTAPCINTTLPLTLPFPLIARLRDTHCPLHPIAFSI